MTEIFNNLMRWVKGEELTASERFEQKNSCLGLLVVTLMYAFSAALIFKR